MFLNMHEGMISQPVLIGTATVLESILCSPGGREGSRDLGKTFRSWEAVGFCRCQTAFFEATWATMAVTLGRISAVRKWSFYLVQKSVSVQVGALPCLLVVQFHCLLSSLLGAEPHRRRSWTGSSPKNLPNVHANGSWWVPCFALKDTLIAKTLLVSSVAVRG